VLPSNSEGLPVAAVEALKSGLAIFASDIPGVHDVVAADGANGARLPAGQIETWVAKLRAVLAQPAVLLPMRQASWDKARDFDLQRIATEYETVLKAAAR
jgi:glycosyltransferase involved in cell wall biosynthesis